MPDPSIIINGCPHCKEAAVDLVTQPENITSVFGGAAGTLALMIQTFDSLYNLYDAFANSDPEEIADQMERKVPERELEQELGDDVDGDIEQMSDEEVRNKLVDEVEEALKTINIEDIQLECQNGTCSYQQKLSRFDPR